MKAIRYFLYTSVIVVIGFLFYIFVFVTWPGETTSVKIIRSGSLGPYKIGEFKEDIIALVLDQSLSPRPKPSECPKNWINVSEMSEIQQSCLLKTDEWEVSIDMYLCAENEDSHLTLYFKENKIVNIKVRCTLGI